MAKMSRLKKLAILAVGALSLWWTGKCMSCALRVRHPWGPKVCANLPDGTQVYFHSRAIGGETEDELVSVTNDGFVRNYTVDEIHAGFSRVVLKSGYDSRQIWVEADGKVGASLDLDTGEFWPELSPQPSWAQYGKGITLCEGRTWSVFDLVLPW